MRRLLILLVAAVHGHLFAENFSLKSPEGWGMSYVTSASLNHSSSFKETLKVGEYTFMAELSSVPKLNAKQQLIGFAGLKSEDLNKSPFFGRGIITTGFFGDSLLELSWTPSIKINDTKPSDMWGVALSKVIYSDERNDVAIRFFNMNGSATASVTCSEDMVVQPLYSEGNISGCVGTSNDVIDLSHYGVELIYHHDTALLGFEPWLAIASTKINPSVEINAPLEFIDERAYVETRGTLLSLNLGADYLVSEKWSLSFGTSFTPLDVNRPSYAGGNDNFWNFKVNITYTL